MYTLPELPYAYDALAPHISAEIVELHHSKHHAAYVAGANQTLERLAEARGRNEWTGVVGLQRTLAFHVAGHTLHSLYWKSMGPAGTAPSADLTAQLARDFGSAEAFRQHVTAVAMNVQGSGWAVVSWEPIEGRLVAELVQDHHQNVVIGATPLLALDMWEHAFYLQYRTVKADYVAAYWELVDWTGFAHRLAAAKG